MSVDIVEFGRRWSCSNWPSDLDVLRHRADEDVYWVRFHTLPGSKRYPDTKQETEMIIDRHMTLLKDLGMGREYFVALSDWTSNAQPDSSSWSRAEAIGIDAKFWLTIQETPDDEDPELSSYRQLYVTELAQRSDELRMILVDVANDLIAGVVIMPADLSWLYHPYDGGVDILLTSEQLRNQLREKHKDWLSSESSGL